MIVYHGSSIAVQHPDVCHSYRALDFGKGFYVTTVWKQAERWAKRKTDLTGSGHAVVSQYQTSDALSAFRAKTFPKDLNERIDFVCGCRDGKDIYPAYDVIIGKVANDKVFRVVDMYHSGIWDRDRALREIRTYPDYDQIAFITQEAVDQLLCFQSAEEV